MRNWEWNTWWECVRGLWGKRGEATGNRKNVHGHITGGGKRNGQFLCSQGFWIRIVNFIFLQRTRESSIKTGGRAWASILYCQWFLKKNLQLYDVIEFLNSTLLCGHFFTHCNPDAVEDRFVSATLWLRDYEILVFIIQPSFIKALRFFNRVASGRLIRSWF